MMDRTPRDRLGLLPKGQKNLGEPSQKVARPKPLRPMVNGKIGSAKVRLRGEDGEN